MIPLRLPIRFAAASSLLFAALAFTGCRTGSLDPGFQPPPIGAESERGASEEKRLSSGRKLWLERMHRAAEGVDWRAIERENGDRAQARRNALAGSLGIAAKATSPWREIGSSNLAGRMHCVAYSSGLDALYAGSSRGGVWRGSLGGAGWTPLADNLYGGAHEIVILPPAVPGGPDVMIAFRDEGWVRTSHDGGATWISPSGLSGLSAVRGVVRLDDPLGTVLFFGRRNTSGAKSVIYASTDRGVSFAPRWQSNAAWDGWLAAPRVGPAAASTLYLLHQGQVLRSTDVAFAFAPLATVDAAASKGVLAISEAGGVLYAAVQSGSQWTLHRSAPGGTGFQSKGAMPDFWEALAASILDSDLVIYGGVEAHRSTNGGGTFEVVNAWGAYYGSPATKLHADLMGIYCLVDPLDPMKERWYFCTDGGVYHSTTQGASVQNLSLSGLGVSQYYSTLTSSNNAARIHAGSQDQGYQRGIYVPPGLDGPSTPFDQLLSGDYGHLTSGDDTHALVFSVYPGFLLVAKGESSTSLVATVDFPPGANYEWLPPLAADRVDPNDCFFGADRLWRYDKGAGNSWTPQLHSNFDFTMGGGNYLTAIAIAPGDPNRMYAANDAGRLFVSTDHGVNWTMSASTAPGEHYFYGNALAIHPADPLEAVVGGSGYSTAGVRRTVDGGVTWTALDPGLPQTHFYDLAFDGGGDVYAGTETGAYRWSRATSQWLDLLGAAAPITTYWSVEHVPGKNVMRFGTYGRGIWDFSLAGCAGSATSFGAGCPGSGGFVPVLGLDGCPSPGDSITIASSGGLGGSTALIAMGPLPLALPIGGGCVIYPFPLFSYTPTLTLSGSGAGQGAFSLTAAIPQSATPGQLVLQVFVADPGSAQGFSNSNALVIALQ
jgi:hypothetical protein